MPLLRRVRYWDATEGEKSGLGANIEQIKLNTAPD